MPVRATQAPIPRTRRSRKCGHRLARSLSSEVAHRLSRRQVVIPRHQRLTQLLQAAQAPNADAAAKSALADFLAREQPKRAHSLIDFNNMPWQVQKPIQAEPADSADALQKKLALPNPPALKSASTQLKSYTPPTDSDLAATLDAPQTAAIQQLAQSLNNDPLKIYKWVHDNIEYFPSQGSIQGAQDTLDKKRGNAIDTASLLVATLRAAKIPAHYVYGTVEIPIDKVMNWVGGTKTPDTAQQILEQGGVPDVALVSTVGSHRAVLHPRVKFQSAGWVNIHSARTKLSKIDQQKNKVSYHSDS
jgi:hypothetical protein